MGPKEVTRTADTSQMSTNGRLTTPIENLRYIALTDSDITKGIPPCKQIRQNNPPKQIRYATISTRQFRKYSVFACHGHTAKVYSYTCPPSPLWRTCLELEIDVDGFTNHFTSRTAPNEREGFKPP